MAWTCTEEDSEYIGGRMMRQKLQEAQRKTKEEIYGCMKEDMKLDGVREEDAEDRV